ncbi:MAG TPA: type IV secretion system protein [Gemmatimonadaceae bacterium]|nr:type IV secretion system protein [Gemmatimonadaceae bacterium]
MAARPDEAQIGDSDSHDHRGNTIVENARREFASAFADLARGKRNWQLIAFALGGVLVLQALTTLRLAATAHPVPYVVEVDRLGTVAAVARADEMRAPDARLIASQLADFIRAVRTVLPSVAGTAQGDLLRRGYAFTAPPAAGFLNTYFSDPGHDPRVLGARLARDVRLTSALKVPEPAGASRGTASRSAQTWRLQWLETDRPLGPLDAGDSAAVAAWEGYVTLQIVPPRTVEAIQDNPLGLRIVAIAWTRVAGQIIPRDSIASLTNPSRVGGPQ